MPWDLYHHFAELAAIEPSGDYHVIAHPRPSRVAVIAPHSGGIVPGTSELARAIARQEFSLYCFEERKSDRNEALHITSTRFDEPACLVIVAASTVVLALHGSAE